MCKLYRLGMHRTNFICSVLGREEIHDFNSMEPFGLLFAGSDACGLPPWKVVLEIFSFEKPESLGKKSLSSRKHIRILLRVRTPMLRLPILFPVFQYLYMPRIRIVFRVFGSFFVICSPSKQSIQNYSLIPCGYWEFNARRNMKP